MDLMESIKSSKRYRPSKRQRREMRYQQSIEQTSKEIMSQDARENSFKIGTLNMKIQSNSKKVVFPQVIFPSHVQTGYIAAETSVSTVQTSTSNEDASAQKKVRISKKKETNSGK